MSCCICTEFLDTTAVGSDKVVRLLKLDSNNFNFSNSCKNSEACKIHFECVSKAFWAYHFENSIDDSADWATFPLCRQKYIHLIPIKKRKKRYIINCLQTVKPVDESSDDEYVPFPGIPSDEESDDANWSEEDEPLLFDKEYRKMNQNLERNNKPDNVND